MTSNEQNISERRKDGGEKQCLKDLSNQLSELTFNPPIKILLVDDDHYLRQNLRQQLEQDGYLVDEAGGVDEAKIKLWESPADLVILDLEMEPQSGYELFEFVQEDPSLKWLPLIILSEKNDIEDKVNCLRMGADDYVTKPFVYRELEARIYRRIVSMHQFEQMAFRDALTGLYNRRYFDNQLQLEIQRAQRYVTPMSLAFLDIDEFKNINDTYGHQVGDVILQGLGSLLQNSLRESDIVARYGGEEMVVILTDTMIHEAKELMEKMLEKVRAIPLAHSKENQVYITFSCGIVQLQEGASGQHLIELADQTMYRAKQEGRNRVLVAPETDQHATIGLDKNERRIGPKKRVLIADNDRAIRSLLMIRLQHLPIELRAAIDGKEAYRDLTREHFDLCIIDGIMPEIDGYLVMEKLRTNGNNNNTKFLMLSNRKKENDMARGLQFTAEDYMAKPFSLVELEIKVRRLLGME